jgi:integrase/recombinase XerD
MKKGFRDEKSDKGIFLWTDENKQVDIEPIQSLTDDTKPLTSIENIQEDLLQCLVGSEKENKSTWFRSYVTKGAQEGIKRNWLDHNGDTFTHEELTAIMESLYVTSMESKETVPVPREGEKGLKKWLVDKVILSIESLHIRQFLISRSKTINAKTLFVLIELFVEFQQDVCRYTKKKPDQLTHQDFSNPSLYTGFLTSKVNYRYFNGFYKHILPKETSPLAYTPQSYQPLDLTYAEEAFIKHMRRQNVKEGRLKKYISEIHRFRNWATHTLHAFVSTSMETFPYHLVTGEHLRDYKAYLIKGNQSGKFSECNSMHHFRNLRTFFKTLYHIGVIKQDICRGLTGIQADDYHERYIPTDEEINRFFSSIDRYSDTPDLDQLAFGFMLFLGLRSCELESLRWEHINRGRQDITFKAKGGKPHSLPLTVDSLRYLDAVETQDEGLVFGLPKGSLRKELAAKYRLYTLIAGWKEASGPHQLRHVFITRLTEKEVPPKILKRLGRHESLKTTSLYIHKSSDHIRKKLNRIRLPWEVHLYAKD